MDRTTFEQRFESSVVSFVENGYPKLFNIVNQTDISHDEFTKPVRWGCISSAFYILRHVASGKIYVGSAKNINKRMYDHEYDLKNKRHKNKTLESLYYQAPEFQFYFVLVNTREEAFDLEQWCSDKYRNSGLLVNVTIDVRSPFLGFVKSNEHKLKIGLANLGKTRTPEQIEQIKKRMLERFQDPTYKEKHSKINIGRKLTPEVIEKIRLSKLGKSQSPETIEKMRQSRKNSEKCHWRPISVDGVEYENFRTAAKNLSLSPTVVRERVLSKSEKFSNWKLKNE